MARRFINPQPGQVTSPFSNIDLSRRAESHLMKRDARQYVSDSYSVRGNVFKKVVSHAEGLLNSNRMKKKSSVTVLDLAGENQLVSVRQLEETTHLTLCLQL